MIRPIVLLAAFAALSTAACAGASSNDGASASADAVTSTTSSLKTKIATCDSKNKTESANAESTMAMVESQVDFRACVSDALDAAVPVIEKILKDNGSASVGSVKDALTKARADNEALCTELHNTSESWGGTLQRVEDAGCSADRERFLADIVLDMVAFDGEAQVPLKDARADHAACYQKYDATDAESTMDMIQVNVDLGTCVMADAAPAIATLAQDEIDNDATFGPLATAQARLQTAIDAKLQSSSVLCDTISEAGENGIGTLSRVEAAACQARVAENAYSFLKPTPEGG